MFSQDIVVANDRRSPSHKRRELRLPRVAETLILDEQSYTLDKASPGLMNILLEKRWRKQTPFFGNF